MERLVSPPGNMHFVQASMEVMQNICTAHVEGEKLRPAYMADVVMDGRAYEKATGAKKQEHCGWQLQPGVAYLLYEPLGFIVAVVGNSTDFFEHKETRPEGLPPEAVEALNLFPSAQRFSRVAAGDVEAHGWSRVYPTWPRTLPPDSTCNICGCQTLCLNGRTMDGSRCFRARAARPRAHRPPARAPASLHVHTQSARAPLAMRPGRSLRQRVV